MPVVSFKPQMEDAKSECNNALTTWFSDCFSNFFCSVWVW